MKNVREFLFQPKLNQTIVSLEESATLAINQIASERRSAGESIVHFGFGESPFPIAEDIQVALRDSAGRKQYLPTKGLPALCAQFVQYYNALYQTSLLEEQIFIGPGSKQLIFNVLFLLEGSVIIPAPSWVSYLPQATILNKKVITPQTTAESKYKLTANQLDQICEEYADEQLTLIINSPNNPTGSVYTQSELIALTDVCREHAVVLISDEIYALFDFNDNFASPAEFYPEGTIVSSGLSKGFSAGGYRLGVMGLPKHMTVLANALSTLISETYSCVAAPVQYAALAAYLPSKKQQRYVTLCMELHRHAADYLYKRFTAVGLTCIQPEGAFYLFPDFSPYRSKLLGANIDGAEQLCARLLEVHGVAALPGSAFYMPEHSLTVRIASVDYNGATALEALISSQELDDKFTHEYMPNLVLGADRIELFVQSL